MKPLLIMGSTDKARFDYAKEVAHENSYNFYPIKAGEFEAFSKHFISSTLDSSQNLFFIFDVDKLSVDDSIRLFELIKGSPHRFILSADSMEIVNYVLKKACMLKPLDKKLSKLSYSLKALMTEKDRDLVRLVIKDMDPEFLFHILKKNAWKCPEVLKPLIRISQKIYKSKPEYIISLLAFAFPKKAFAISRKKKKTKSFSTMQKQLKEIAKTYRILNSCEVADLYLLSKRLEPVPEEAIALSKEKEILNPVCPKTSQTLEASPKISPLSEFF